MGFMVCDGNVNTPGLIFCIRELAQIFMLSHSNFVHKMEQKSASYTNSEDNIYPDGADGENMVRIKIGALCYRKT